MADEARCTPLHPENMDATCSDVCDCELLAPTSFHVVHGGCASVLNVDKALIGQLSPLGKLSPTMESQRERENFGCRRDVILNMSLAYGLTSHDKTAREHNHRYRHIPC